MGFLKRIQKFFHEVRVELKKVHWPTRREFAVFFSIVVSTILVVGVFFWVLDSGLTRIVEIIVTR